MYCIVGLGNPGNEYTRTRHNVGFMTVDEIAAVHGLTFHPGKGEYWYTHCSLNNHDVALVKPVTYMNNSGSAVQEFLEQRDIHINNLLVVCDDFQLPLGSIRLRQNGTDGGHHGLSSIIYHMQTDQFARLRCGIASALKPVEKSQMKNFVLEQFSESEVPMVKSMVQHASDACISFIMDGIERTMNKFNIKPSEESN
jgi:PTH1 family peptidyl-tRNA hydrolase